MECLSETTVSNPDYEKAVLANNDEGTKVETLTLTAASMILKNLLDDTIITTSATEVCKEFKNNYYNGKKLTREKRLDETRRRHAYRCYA